ncbi:MAG: hypothetical protein ABGZ35_12085 [Planctomycetaceae bacterium]|jgi:hypothetical protein
MKLFIPLIVCLLAGCADEMISTDPSRNKPLRVKGTDRIGEFKGDGQVVKPEVKITNPITGPLEAYEPLKQRIAALSLDHAVNLFRALEGRYPKDYDEFMQRVIKDNKMQLPKPVKGLHYEYDVENHKLLVVKDADQAEKD